jgi:hypothetical protein
MSFNNEVSVDGLNAKNALSMTADQAVDILDEIAFWLDELETKEFFKDRPNPGEQIPPMMLGMVVMMLDTFDKQGVFPDGWREMFNKRSNLNSTEKDLC